MPMLTLVKRRPVLGLFGRGQRLPMARWRSWRVGWRRTSPPKCSST